MAYGIGLASPAVLWTHYCAMPVPLRRANPLSRILIPVDALPVAFRSYCETAPQLINGVAYGIGLASPAVLRTHCFAMPVPLRSTNPLVAGSHPVGRRKLLGDGFLARESSFLGDGVANGIRTRDPRYHKPVL